MANDCPWPYNNRITIAIVVAIHRI